MVNLDKYMEECSASAENAYEAINFGERRISRKEGFRLRYFCYVEWGMPLFDMFNKDYRVANFLAKVLEISYEYTEDYANFGWDKYEVVLSFKRIRRAARFIGYRGQFKVVQYGRRVKVYIGDVAYSIKNASQAIETMYDIADYLASQCVDEELSEFVGSFMTREYKWMNAISFS